MSTTSVSWQSLQAAVSESSWSREPHDLAAHAPDASHYLLAPAALATPTSIDEVSALMSAARRAELPITFRSGGTSLSGQAGTDSVLVDVRKHLNRIEILDDGRRVRCQPGAVLRRVNAALAPYRRRLGPDPASEIACTIGGVVANNSSGMTSSHTATAYYTVESMRFVLASGTTVDTAADDASQRLASEEPDLVAGLLAIRDRLRREPSLRSRIEHQFSMKNTMGYGLNAFLDHDEPAQILAHLLIGSEGTLGFVADVVFRTLPTLPHVSTGLVVTDTIDAAVAAVDPLLAAGAVAVELMDAAALRVAQGLDAAPAQMRALTVASHTALLVEAQAESPEHLSDITAGLSTAIDALPLSVPTDMTSDPAARAAMWAVRKGLYAAVASTRKPGTTNLLEDIAFPTGKLRAGVAGLEELLQRYGYDEAVTFGHARDANLHFMITPRLDDRRELQAYEAFTEDLVDLVLGQDGTLKAEHGTGRMMAPYVRRQFGDELYEVMQQVKKLCDPTRVLAPEVVISDDPQVHMRDLKSFPAADAAVDSCVECGFCEPTCPSRNTTTTPRQRIVLMREIARAGARGENARARELEQAFGYQAVQTCAADSLCQRACPVGIDTGAVMKARRAAGHGRGAQAAGVRVAKNWNIVEGAARLGLGIADKVPGGLLSGVTAGVRQVLPTELVPQLGDDLPAPGRRRSTLRATASPAEAEVVFFPSCTGSMFGGPAQAFLDLCAAAGAGVTIAAEVDALCCGTPWSSKGFTQGQQAMAVKVLESLWRSSRAGQVPIVMDAASCTHGLQSLGDKLPPADAGRWARLQILDSLTWVRRELLDRLVVAEDGRLDRVVLHPTCATEHLQATDDLVALARAVAREVVVPSSWGCCGFAGDRGMLHPELTAGATRDEAREVAEVGTADAYLSANRTCEMGMSRATGRSYQHVLQALAAAVER
ncbi:MAG: FAD-binding and (Fe-S)-binding domain-containing protein [Beutenbergiaceae bacterium]